MKPKLLMLSIALVCLSAMCTGCGKTTLVKAMFVPSEFKGGLSLAVKPFSMAVTPQYDGEPSEDPVRQAASMLAEALSALGLFRSVRVLEAQELGTTDLVLEGAFVLVDDGQRAPLVALVGRHRTFSSVVVTVRIVKVATGTVVYQVSRLGVHAPRPTLSLPINTIRSRAIRKIAQLVADDLGAELR